MGALEELAVAVAIAIAVASLVIWLRKRVLRGSLQALLAEKKSLEYRIKESQVSLYKKRIKATERESRVGEMVRKILAINRRVDSLRSALEWHGEKQEK